MSDRNERRLILPGELRREIKKQNRILLHENGEVRPHYLEETVKRLETVQRFCLPPWETQHLWLEGWQPMVESVTDGGLYEGTCFRLRELTVPVNLAVSRMEMEARCES